MHSCPPPAKHFLAALGVRYAKFLPSRPAFIRRGRSRGRFAVGMRYEREAKEWLSLFALGRADLVYQDGPWLEYADETGKRWCQPDALLVNAAKRTCTILEIKYSHTSDAWYQLKQLYLPVLRVAMPGYSFSMLEVVHWFDPQAAWPEPRIANVPALDGIQHPCDLVQVTIFNRRRERRIHEARHSDGKGAGEEASPIWPAQGTK